MNFLLKSLFSIFHHDKISTFPSVSGDVTGTIRRIGFRKINPFRYSASCMTLFIFFINSLRGNKTLWPQPWHLIRMSAPIRIIFQAFVPHGCGFFISTMSFNLNVFVSIILISPRHHSTRIIYHHLRISHRNSVFL